MRVAAYQAPYLPFGSFEAVGLIAEQIAASELAGVDVLCCPEGVLGGHALEADGQSPADVALGVDDGELDRVVAPLLGSHVTVLVGFTERGTSGALFSSVAILEEGRVAGVHRKAYPGYRTAIGGGHELPLFWHGATPFGIIVCNDIWYVEPARVHAAAGAAVHFDPSNSGHLREPSPSMQARGTNLPIARAVENSMTVVVSDIAGHVGDRLALGSSAVIDPDGVVVRRAEPHAPTLLVADVESKRRPADPRGWDGSTNPAVTERFLALWSTDG